MTCGKGKEKKKIKKKRGKQKGGDNTHELERERSVLCILPPLTANSSEIRPSFFPTCSPLLWWLAFFPVAKWFLEPESTQNLAHTIDIFLVLACHVCKGRKLTLAFQCNLSRWLSGDGFKKSSPVPSIPFPRLLELKESLERMVGMSASTSTISHQVNSHGAAIEGLASQGQAHLQ